MKTLDNGRTCVVGFVHDSCLSEASRRCSDLNKHVNFGFCLFLTGVRVVPEPSDTSTTNGMLSLTGAAENASSSRLLVNAMLDLSASDTELLNRSALCGVDRGADLCVTPPLLPELCKGRVLYCILHLHTSTGQAPGVLASAGHTQQAGKCKHDTECYFMASALF